MPRPPRATRREVLEETRCRLLDTAATEFAQQGFAGANINHISRQAGFAKGTVYNYFPSKRALMLALIQETAADHVACITQAVRQEQSPEARLDRFFAAGFAFVSRNLPRARVMAGNVFGSDMEFKEAMHLAYQPLFQLVAAEIIGPGIALGRFRPVDPAAMAGLLMTIYLGTGSQADEQGRSYLDPTQVAEFCLYALGAHPPTSRERS